MVVQNQKEVASWLIFLLAQPLAHGFGAVPAPALSAKRFLPLGIQTPLWSELVLLHDLGIRNAEATLSSWVVQCMRRHAGLQTNCWHRV